MCALALLPHTLQSNFLGPAMAADILALISEQQEAFQVSQIGIGETWREDLDYRRSKVLRASGDAKHRLRAHITPLLPELMYAVGIKIFPVHRIEIEFSVHGDGDYYKIHIDTRTGPNRQQYLRRLSLVLHLFYQPRSFTGGALRLHSPDGQNWLDIEPEHNRLVGFPSFIPHEVLPVFLPGNAFERRRFAVNIWVHG